MKNPIRVAALFLSGIVCTCCTNLSADSISSPAKDQKIGQTIKRLEQNMIAALVKDDLQKLESFVDKDSVYVSEEGEIQHGEEAFKEIKSGALKITKAELGPIEIHTFGDVAIATYIVTAEGVYQGKPISGKYATTDVFKRKGSDWKIVSSQNTRVKTN
jgi:ketosteroid isomerase-like protein